MLFPPPRRGFWVQRIGRNREAVESWYSRTTVRDGDYLDAVVIESRNDGVGAAVNRERRDSVRPVQCREPTLSIGRARNRHRVRRITHVHYLDAVVTESRNDGVSAVTP
eukprot:COSAG03_NODE_2130_length_3093_cov_2.846693_1_plen_108_part_10